MHIFNRLLRAIGDNVWASHDGWSVDIEDKPDAAKACEEILEEVNVDFGNWLRHNCSMEDSVYKYIETDETKSVKELFIIFKAEKYK